MDGLRIDLMDVNKFIKLNHLENSVITDVQYITNGHPTPGGLLSYEIFGSSVDDRKERMGIIDLHGKYMTPLAAKKLPAYDRKLNAILTSTTRYKLVDGELIEDDISGRTGPSFLYEIWGKYKPKEKKSITTKEIEKFFSMPRDLLFIEYLPVIPAFFRDVNSQSGGKMSLADINSIYSRIITLAENLNKFTDSFGLIRPQSEARLQSSLVDVYDQLVIKKVKGSPSKFGMLRRYWQSKSITYTARMVITAPILTRDTVEDTHETKVQIPTHIIVHHYIEGTATKVPSKVNGEVVEDESLLALHMDYDNHTFAFDKTLLYLADAVNLENLGEIDNNGSNTF